MTNREKIAALKNVQSSHEEISNLLAEIIENTFDYHCDRIFNFNIGDDSIFVFYEYCCRGEYGREEVHIPIAWLDEGFDYKEAYTEMRRQEALAAIRKEEEEKKRLKELRKAKAKQREEQEYKRYLALKQKYECEVTK
jgi:hypothetical protein